MYDFIGFNVEKTCSLDAELTDKVKTIVNCERSEAEAPKAPSHAKAS